MIYFIRCLYYRDAEYFLRREASRYGTDLDICGVDLMRLMVKMKNGDEVYYVPAAKLETWKMGRNWTEIDSLSELAERKEE